MAEKLVTVATFENSVQAELAKSQLESAGIKAVVIDGNLIDTAWQYTTAVGGVKVQVLESDREKAESLLQNKEPSDFSEDFPDETTELAREENTSTPSQREKDADRSLRTAVFGIVLLPLQVYALILILKVFASRQTLSDPHRRRWITACVINFIFWLLIIGFFLRISAVF